jgi:hypothetical protein
MPRKSITSRTRPTNGNGNGILGSGIFGLFGNVTNIECSSTDKSIYCNIMKVFSVIFSFFFLCLILFIVYSLFKRWRKS